MIPILDLANISSILHTTCDSIIKTIPKYKVQVSPSRGALLTNGGELGMVGHTCTLSSQEAQAGGLTVQARTAQ